MFKGVEGYSYGRGASNLRNTDEVENRHKQVSQRPAAFETDANLNTMGSDMYTSGMLLNPTI